MFRVKLLNIVLMSCRKRNVKIRRPKLSTMLVNVRLILIKLRVRVMLRRLINVKINLLNFVRNRRKCRTNRTSRIQVP